MKQEVTTDVGIVSPCTNCMKKDVCKFCVEMSELVKDAESTLNLSYYRFLSVDLKCSHKVAATDLTSPFGNQVKRSIKEESEQ